MSEFCVKCSEHEGNIELLLKRHHMEMQCMKQKLKDLQDENAKLQNQNEALIMDVAFYGGNLINLSCNNK
jgi:hypothetical protein